LQVNGSRTQDAGEDDIHIVVVVSKMGDYIGRWLSVEKIMEVEVESFVLVG
jgi:hypothetical protein